MTPALRVQNLSKSFGGLEALKGLGLEVIPNEILGLIGPNGAGKTTLFNTICGVFPPDSGAVFLEDRNITGLSTHRIARMGIGRTFQIVKPFNTITVERNILAALGKDRTRGLSAAIFSTGLKKYRDEVRNLLELVGLEEFIDHTPNVLPLGHQKRMEIARALALRPKLLMLDEPFAGLGQEDIASLVRLIKILKADGLTILLIEHNVPYIMELCDRVAVLNFGQKLCEGLPHEVRNDRSVIDAYLGD